MSWRFPVRQPVDGDPMDVDDANATMMPVSEEIAGNLNEHNFASGGITTRSRVADDVFCSLFQTYEAVDGSTTGGTGTHVAEVEITGAWAPIYDSANHRLNKSITTTREGLFWIMASFQTQQAFPGVLYGLFLDGVLLEETVCGTADASSEWNKANAGGVGAGATTLLDAHAPVTLETIVPVQAGTHMVEVRGGVPPGRPSAVTFRVYSREILVLELAG